MSIFVYSHPSAAQHDPGPGHPEAPIRIKVIDQALDRLQLPGLHRLEAPQASREQIARVHPESYIDRVLSSVPASGHVRLDADTVMSPASGEAALRQSGAVCAAVDAVMAGETKRAFCAMRPPGHHAEPAHAMGFCLFNGIAVGALQARAVHGIERISIFDFDVHHGNGTQASFWDDAATQYLSTHQMPLYPGTGARTERGAHGNIINRPCRPGTGSFAWRELVEDEILPSIDAFAPGMILLSAGFDAHVTDPLAQMELVEADFRWVTERCVELAERHCQGRLVSVLEGGYNPPALAASVVEHLRGMALGAA